jgi:hypothetical protein
VEGVWVAIVILAMHFIEHILAKSQTRQKLRVVQFVIAPLFLSTLVLLIGGIMAVSTLTTPIFRNSSEVDAFLELKTRCRPEDVVLASYNTGNALPAWTPIRVVIGHGPESTNLAELLPQVEAFFASETSNTIRINLISELNVTYIFWGPEEQEIGDWEPQYEPYLSRVYSKNGYEIYIVDLPSL